MQAEYYILSPEQTAALLQVSRKTVYRWIAAKKLKVTKTGPRKFVIYASDLDKFLHKHMTY